VYFGFIIGRADKSHHTCCALQQPGIFRAARTETPRLRFKWPDLTGGLRASPIHIRRIVCSFDSQQPGKSVTFAALGQLYRSPLLLVCFPARDRMTAPKRVGSGTARFIATLRGLATVAIHSALAATPDRKVGGTSFIESPKSLPNRFEIIRVNLAELRREAPVVDRPYLVEAHVLILILQSNMHIPRASVVVGATRKNPCASFRRIRPRKAFALSVHSDPTFSPTLAHHTSRSDTCGGRCLASCSFS
jgi:hypothetical protein